MLGIHNCVLNYRMRLFSTTLLVDWSGSRRLREAQRKP